jgi:hypothetical protein
MEGRKGSGEANRIEIDTNIASATRGNELSEGLSEDSYTTYKVVSAPWDHLVRYWQRDGHCAFSVPSLSYTTAVYNGHPGRYNIKE